MRSRRPRMGALAALLCLFPTMVSSCTAEGDNSIHETPGSGHLLVFAGDRDGKDSDFLMVMDVDPDSPRRGQAISSIPIGHKMSMPHHMEYVAPLGGEPIFMNAHDHELSMIVDISHPGKARLAKTFAPPKPFRFPHDYTRTPSGTRLVGFLRSDGASPDPQETNVPGNHGGIAEYTVDGRLIRSISAAVPGFTKPIRPYAFALLPAIDRFVVTSAPMMEQSWADVIQIYRYSDFKLLHTIALPPGVDESGRRIAGSQAAGFGPRVLDDGSVFLNSYGCAFYHLTEIGSEHPVLKVVHAVKTGAASNRGKIRGACGIPLRIGHYWVQPVGGLQAVVVLDIAAPDAPTEVFRLRMPANFNPHWLAQDPIGNRLVLGAEFGGEHGFYILRFNRNTGRLGFDHRFRDTPAEGTFSFLAPARPGYISLDKAGWPHGRTGAAWGHAALFLK